MSRVEVESFIARWLAAANRFDTEKFLAQWHSDAILDDPSVGEIFKGHSGIRKYFEDYFVGYKTQTKLLKLAIASATRAHMTVEFTGEFPGGKIGGTFDFVFRDGKISKARAALL